MRKMGLYEGILLFGIAAVERSPRISKLSQFRKVPPCRWAEFRPDRPLRLCWPNSEVLYQTSILYVFTWTYLSKRMKGLRVEIFSLKDNIKDHKLTQRCFFPRRVISLSKYGWKCVIRCRSISDRFCCRKFPAARCRSLSLRSSRVTVPRPCR